ncbi:MAG: hypothetical protein WD448_05325 [Woeseia sp.]
MTAYGRQASRNDSIVEAGLEHIQRAAGQCLDFTEVQKRRARFGVRLVFQLRCQTP